jgi:uncharacterized membrane protein
MIYLIPGLLLFFSSHCISIVNEPWRDQVADRIGPVQWKGLHTLVTLPGFVLMCWGFGLARQDPPVHDPGLAAAHHNATYALRVPAFPGGEPTWKN